jgi:hypothetical protein
MHTLSLPRDYTIVLPRLDRLLHGFTSSFVSNWAIRSCAISRPCCLIAKLLVAKSSPDSPSAALRAVLKDPEEASGGSRPNHSFHHSINSPFLFTSSPLQISLLSSTQLRFLNLANQWQLHSTHHRYRTFRNTTLPTTPTFMCKDTQD